MPLLPPIYLITDRHKLAGDRFFAVLEELLAAGLRMIQLREKDQTAAELYPLAKRLRELTAHYQCRLLINDRIDIALAVGADGVHLGGHSLPAAVARRLLGPDKLICVSTHSAAEAIAAAETGADFITYGPVFYTPSKAAYGPPAGVDSLEEVCRLSSLPVYALGGISVENLTAVMKAGADGIAAISTLLTSSSPKQTFQRLMRQMDPH